MQSRLLQDAAAAAERSQSAVAGLLPELLAPPPAAEQQQRPVAAKVWPTFLRLKWDDKLAVAVGLLRGAVRQAVDSGPLRHSGRPGQRLSVLKNWSSP